MSAPGYETLVTQIFVKGDPIIEDDAVFTASNNMVGDFKKVGDNFLLAYDFPLKPGVSIMPKATVDSVKSFMKSWDVDMKKLKT